MITINDIIGEGKDLEPPFSIRQEQAGYEAFIMDSNGTLLLPVDDISIMDDEKCLVIAKHIVELLNREHL